MIRRRPLIAAVLVLAAAGVPAAVLAVGNDPKADPDAGGVRNTDHVTAALGWKGRPETIRVAGLPRDRVMAGELRNGSLRPADLAVEDIRVLDTRGRSLSYTARFARAFAHGLYSAEAQNLYGKPGASERRRLGEIVTVKPGEAVPVTLSWRLRDPATPAAKIEFGGRAVAVPAGR